MRETFDAVPFLWTEQYNFGLTNVGHAAPVDAMQIDGGLEKRNCKISYLRDGKQLAVTVIHRDLAGLREEVAFERTVASPVTQTSAQ